MLVLEPKYDIGQIVYLKTDSSQSERIVFCYRVYQKEILYELAFGASTSCHYDFEISEEKNLVIS